MNIPVKFCSEAEISDLGTKVPQLKHPQENPSASAGFELVNPGP